MVKLKKYPILLPIFNTEVEVVIDEWKLHGTDIADVYIYQYQERGVFKFLGLKKVELAKTKYVLSEFNYDYIKIVQEEVNEYANFIFDYRHKEALQINETLKFKEWNGKL